MLNRNALRLLNQRKMRNALLIRTLEREPGTEAYVYNGSAAVYENRSGSWLFGIEHEGDFTRLLAFLGKPLKTFYVNTVEPWEEIRSVLRDAQMRAYMQYNIGADMFKADPSVINPGIEIVPVDKSWTDFILALYKSGEFGNRDYIDACIESNPGFGAILDGERVGYVLIHLNGEIGSMVIAEKVRGKGVGSTLMQRITPVYAAQASMGCGFVLPDNQGSRRMLEKSCFTPLDEKVMWVYRRGSEKEFGQ